MRFSKRILTLISIHQHTNMRVVIILSVMLVTASVECKRVLGIYGHPGKSHQFFGEVILTKLAERDHQVTMVSAFPKKSPLANYTDVFLDGFLEEIDSDDTIYLEMEKSTLLNFIGAYELMQHFANLTFGHPAMQKLIKSGQKFDLIVMDWFCKDSELFYGNIFEAPIIVTSSFGTQGELNYAINNPEPYSYVPASGFTYTDEMGFFDRLGNTLAVFFVEAFLFYNKIQQKRILDYHFKNAPTIDEVRRNIDLVFSNAHPVFETPRPYVPNVIRIGGIHVQEPEPLPKDLKDFLDSSPHGVVYFSFGSHMKISALPSETISSILGALSRIPQKVLLKWEKDEVPPLSPNVMVRKWMPQNNILAHPNVKVFVTHGGLMSKIEAIHHGVPMIGVPIFAEQMTNVAHSVQEGIALRVRFRELTEETLFNALSKIINDSSYAQNIKKKSSLLRDQPMKPIDTAIYWAEFVMRHNGTKHLQNKAMKLQRYQYLLLDVAAFIISVIVLIVVIIRKLFALVVQFLFGKRTDKVSNKKVKKH